MARPSLTIKAHNVNTSGTPFTVAGLTWTAGRRGIIAVASASSGDISSISIAGGAETWVSIAGIQTYGVRRALDFFITDQTPADGDLTFTPVAGTGTYQETQYIIAELADFDAISTLGTPDRISTSSGTSLNTASLGTIGANDRCVIASAFESGADNWGAAGGSTELQKRIGGGNVRSLLLAYSDTDDTPGVVWDTDGNACGLIGVLIHGTAGAAAAALPPIPPGMPPGRRLNF